MNAEVVLRSVLSLMGFWFFVYYLWRDYRIDSFRDHVFSIRDRMFLYAAQGNISFEHPAYTLLRNRMNAVMRYGHVFTMSRMLIALATHEKMPKGEAIKKWEQAVEQLPSEIQRKMKEFNLCFAIALLQHMLYLSFLRYAVLRPFMFFANPFRINEGVWVVSSVEQLESDAQEQDARRIARLKTRETATA
jgi:hypothetical protein